ncbi:deoxyribodipyrimidine photolyase [Idiomarina tyrosinivorans]|uniref:Cryptochrome DASH n=1 Tax=Idiomarina tyrosinivorans TaxID=1445662 RepID=A0A432ZUA2_9GAMM|nr:DASH family cryptochrome [Idiomarina tyrosinivorans]RUO81524.1 deoxyribodipyrimidine photolyase [Idiomarina tyrosinivorans]
MLKGIGDSLAQFRTGLFWFHNDLRLHDHPALAQACKQCEQLLCVVTIDNSGFNTSRYGLTQISALRQTFIAESVNALAEQLAAYGQQLLVLQGQPLNDISELLAKYNVDAVFRSHSQDYYHNQRWQKLQRRYPFLHFAEYTTTSLFSEQQLPCDLQNWPDTFSKFRRKLDQQQPPQPLEAIETLPATPLKTSTQRLPVAADTSSELFHGGEQPALQKLKRYFSSQLPQSYQQTRNHFDDPQGSTYFSAWLANGSLSARQVVAELRRHEARFGANKSTNWIYFELLWREYFYWYAVAHGTKLFQFSGIKAQPPRTSFYPQRFAKWCSGNTPYPIVNASMRQLRQTGYLSNRARQLVASCLVHELAIDWRYGAAYFEQQLVDYDVSSNWGNWQYLAGVGADPRGHRHFDLVKQTQMYDPDHAFIQRWQGNAHDQALDINDAADWPIQ